MSGANASVPAEAFRRDRRAPKAYGREMTNAASLSGTAALIGDPARANILAALLDGRALTATELAYTAGITAPTASGHLAKLVEGRMLSVAVQGRHRYSGLPRLRSPKCWRPSW